MLKQPIDTTKEVKFYPHKGVIVANLFAAIALAYVIYLIVPGSQNSLIVNSLGVLVLGGLSLYLLIIGVKYLSRNPLLLKIDKNGIYSPKTGEILWSNVEDITVKDSPNRALGLGEYIKIVLKDGTSHIISTAFLGVSTLDLRNIFKSYRSSV